MFTTSGTFPWSFVTQIFHNGQPCHGGDRKIFEVMTSTLPKGTLGSVASLLAATKSLIKSSQHNSFHNKKPHQNWMKSKNSIYLLNMPKFWIWDTCRPFFRNKITKHVDGPSIAYKDEHFAENYIKIGWKFKKLILLTSYVKNSNSYIMTIYMFLEGISPMNA